MNEKDYSYLPAALVVIGFFMSIAFILTSTTRTIALCALFLAPSKHGWKITFITGIVIGAFSAKTGTFALINSIIIHATIGFYAGRIIHKSYHSSTQRSRA